MSTEKQEQQETPTGTQREFREYALGNVNVEHLDVHPIAGLGIPKKKARHLMFLAEHWEPPRWPDDHEKTGVVNGFDKNFWNTPYARRAIRVHTTETATQAVAEDNASQLATMVGDPDHESDVSGLHAINQLSDWLVNSENLKMIFLSSSMGSGKTSFSLLLFEIYYNHFHRLEKAMDDSVVMPEFAANFDISPPRGVNFKQINEYPTFKEWVQDGKSETDNKAFLFDEGSTALTAQSGENQEKVVEKMNELVKKSRKGGVKLIIWVGHDGKDIAPLIRSLCDYVEKPDLKKAEFYQGVRNRKGVGHLFSIDGIPESSNWNYDTNDTADWVWGDEAGSEGYDDDDLKRIRNERIVRLYKTFDHLTYSDIGEVFDISESQVGNIIQAHEDDISIETTPDVAKMGAD